MSSWAYSPNDRDDCSQQQIHTSVLQDIIQDCSFKSSTTARSVNIHDNHSFDSNSIHHCSNVVPMPVRLRQCACRFGSISRHTTVPISCLPILGSHLVLSSRCTFSNSSLMGLGKILETSSAAFSARGMHSWMSDMPNFTITCR